MGETRNIEDPSLVYGHRNSFQTSQYIVCDLDGTLSNDYQRRHYIVNEKRNELWTDPHWDKFHSECRFDPVHHDVHGALLALQKFYPIIYLTGRTEEWRWATIDWLIESNLTCVDLRMRPDGNYTPDAELKPKLLDLMPDQVAFILEDRTRMVEEWRRLGFNCWQVRKTDT